MATGRKAFTLMELLLAAGLLAVAAAAVGAMMRAGFVARAATGRAAGHSRSLVLALDQIAGPLQSALPPRGVLAGAFVGEHNTACGSDVLSFHAAADGHGSEWGDVAKLEFRLEEQLKTDAERGYRFIRLRTRNLLSPRQQQGEAEVLCRGVKSFEVRYFDGADWYDEWNSADLGNALPNAVEIILVLETDEEEAETSITRVENDYPTMRRIMLLPCAVGQEASR